MYVPYSGFSMLLQHTNTLKKLNFDTVHKLIILLNKCALIYAQKRHGNYFKLLINVSSFIIVVFLIFSFYNPSQITIDIYLYIFDDIYCFIVSKHI